MVKTETRPDGSKWVTEDTPLGPLYMRCGYCYYAQWSISDEDYQEKRAILKEHVKSEHR